MDTDTILFIVIGAVALFVVVILALWLIEVAVAIYETVRDNFRLILVIGAILISLGIIVWSVYTYGPGVLSVLALFILISAIINRPSFMRRTVVVVLAAAASLALSVSVIFAVGAGIYYLIFGNLDVITKWDDPEFQQTIKEYLLYIPLVILLALFAMGALFGGGGGGRIRGYGFRGGGRDLTDDDDWQQVDEDQRPEFYDDTDQDDDLFDNGSDFVDYGDDD